MPLYRVQKMRVRQVGAILTSKGFKLGAGGGANQRWRRREGPSLKGRGSMPLGLRIREVTLQIRFISNCVRSIHLLIALGIQVSEIEIYVETVYLM